MKRFLIGGLAAVVILLATLGISTTVTSSLKATGVAEVEQAALRAARQYEQLSRLEGIDFARLASHYASRSAIATIADELDETARRKAAFTQSEFINGHQENEGRRLDIVAILDAQGKIIARNLNAEAMKGDDLAAKYPSVKVALKGEAIKDVWNFAGRTTQVAVAPIRKGETVVGALLMGYVIGFKGMREMRELLGAEVGLFHENKVQTSSFTNDTQQENGNKTSALSQAVFGEGSLAAAAISTGMATEVRHLMLDGEEYAAVALPIPGNSSEKSAGVVVLASLATAGGLASGVGAKIWMLGVIAILIVLVVSVLVAKRFITPIDKMELGVADIINGNIDYMFEPVGYDLDGLSNGLNVMLARLLGREEPNEEEADEEDANKWKAEKMVIDTGDGTPAGANPAALAQESEAAYYPRLFNEYLNAMRASGARADGVAVQMFTAKLRLVEGGLRRKWNCRMVRFQLVNQGGQPVFQAVKIA